MTTTTARQILSKVLPSMSKTEEIEHWYIFLCSLPAESYLRDILEPISCDIVDAIRNDHGFIDWQRIQDEQAKARQTIQALYTEIAALKDKKTAMDAEKNEARKQLDTAKTYAIASLQQALNTLTGKRV